jgi:hypothetical protein
MSNILACSVLALKVIDSSMVSVSPDVDREGSPDVDREGAGVTAGAAVLSVGVNANPD